MVRKAIQVSEPRLNGIGGFFLPEMSDFLASRGCQPLHVNREFTIEGDRKTVITPV